MDECYLRGVFGYELFLVSVGGSVRKIISEAAEYIIGIVVLSLIVGWVAWGSLAFLTADVSDVKIKTHERPAK
jgi:hypothetical protein